MISSSIYRLLLTVTVLFSTVKVAGQESHALVESQPFVFVNDALSGSLWKQIAPERIESMHVYKDNSEIPEHREGIEPLLDKGVIFIELKKPIEKEHPVKLLQIMKMKGLSSSDRLWIEGVWLEDKNIKVFPSAIQRAEVTKDEKGSYLSIRLLKHKTL